MNPLQQADPEVWQAIQGEAARQRFGTDVGGPRRGATTVDATTDDASTFLWRGAVMGADAHAHPLRPADAER